MRTRFNQQLELIHTELIQMGSLCEESIALAIQGLLKYDSSFSGTIEPEVVKNKTAFMGKVAEIEIEINQKERDIEAQCMKMILQQQPVASDLRMISATLKMIIDMERIGDQATDIAEISQFVAEDSVMSKVHIKDMATEVIHMVTSSIDSFVKKDLVLAREVIAQDDVVDGYFDIVKKDLTKFIRTDIENGEKAIDLIMIAKYLERIGDHAVNICERVIYSITGQQE
ncbi:phosphate signaling complex protein PhoU [Scatolibacter rhodanostii]|uniref:phosphate signaling complex protein PhoU n=1 Tax=Scatolibacter rhodanostii TaxID=2014781 RepID=UPI000C076AA0|nr:phosphate signaling complex protein PhoU [Scatolibacter rhodanostii]